MVAFNAIRNYKPRFTYKWNELKTDAKTDSALAKLSAKFKIPEDILHNFHSNHAAFRILSGLDADSIEAWNMDSSLTRPSPQNKDSLPSWETRYDGIHEDLGNKIREYWHKQQNTAEFREIDSTYRVKINQMRRQKIERWEKWKRFF